MRIINICKAYSFAALVLSVMVLSGCAQLSFYGQGAIGHTKLMAKRQAISSVLRKSQDETLKRQLLLSQQILAFAHTELALPETKSYRSYVALKDDFPVWNVVAAKEFSLRAESWCYLVIGCANYRGYFKRKRALAYAEKLRAKGMETHVGGAIAYSTLGWFRDPILSSMLAYGDLYLAETLFHELAHQQLYLNNWTELNESFATVVANEGMRRWLADKSPQQWSEFQAGQRADDDFAKLVVALKESLQTLYASDLDIEDKRLKKNALMSGFKGKYQQLKQQQWNNRGWYDNWVNQPLNNARLVAYSNYQSYVPELEALLKACNNSLPRFYNAVEKLDVKILSVTQGKELPKSCR